MNTVNQFFQHAAQPIGRGLLASLFLVAGLGKISAYAGTASYMQAMGVPTALLPGVIALEVGGALALIVGWKTRLSAFLLAGFSVLSAMIFHADFADSIQQVMFLKNVSIAGGLLLLVAHGAGAWSLDHVLRRPLEGSGNARIFNA